MDDSTIASEPAEYLPAYYCQRAAKVSATNPTQWQEYEALAYEIEMLGATARLLAPLPDEPSPMRNALLESFALHFRNLVGFLWPAPDQGERKPKDVLVGHLAPGWQPTKPTEVDLDGLTQRASRQVAHLTTHRLSGRDERKRWPVTECIDAILPALDMLLQQPQARDRLSPKIAREVHELRQMLDRPAGPSLAPVRQILVNCYLGTQTARPIGFYNVEGGR